MFNVMNCFCYSMLFTRLETKMLNTFKNRKRKCISNLSRTININDYNVQYIYCYQKQPTTIELTRDNYVLHKTNLTKPHELDKIVKLQQFVTVLSNVNTCMRIMHKHKLSESSTI